MGLRVLRGGRRQIGDVGTYVGEFGTVFYDENTGTLRLSDGVTPGGITNIVPPATVSTVGGIKPGASFSVTGDGTLNLRPATSTLLGGIKAGPGIVVDSEGTLFIDSSGLSFNFGDFTAAVGTYPDSSEFAVLGTVTANEDMFLASNGTGSVNVVGEFSVYKTDGNILGAIAESPIFTVKSDGQVQMLVPGADALAGAVTIVGGTNGVFQPPVNTGVMLHVTGIAGSPGVPSRIYNDAQNAFSAFVARRYNGSAAVPTAVLDGEEIMRLSGTSHNGTTLPASPNQRITFKALGNQTLTNQGGSIELATTPLNSTTLALVATVDNANGISSTKFTGPVLQNGNSNVSIAANANVTVSAAGNAAILTVTGTGANIAGTANVTGNANVGNLGAAQVLASANVTAPQLISNIAVGTAPLVVTSTTQVPNLNVAVAGSLVNGNSNVSITANANVNISASGNANVLTVTGSSVVANGVLSSTASISDSKGDVRSVPLNSQTGSYQLTATDNGKMISITTGGVTVPAGVFVSPFGQIVSIFNDSVNSQTITQGASVTLRLAGTLSTGNRSLARYGIATITCVAANTFVISGAGIT